LIKAQIALAKLELQQSGRAAGTTGIFIVGALSMAAMGGIFLLVTLAYVLVALGLPVWAGFGIVTLVLFLVAAVLGLLGKKASSKIKGPDRTIAQIEQTKAALQSAVEQPANVQRALPER
jgi:membrane protein implicated in regulation of membrane protease activity